MSTNDITEIYENTKSMVNLISENVNLNVENDEIKALQDDAKQTLSRITERVNEAIEELKINSEWDSFTLAFYGETNAGKSTLIETLRILLHENTKEEERRQFKEIDVIIGNLKQEILEAEMELQRRQAAFLVELQVRKEALAKEEASENKLAVDVNTYKTIIDNLNQAIEEAVKQSFINRIKKFFNKLPEQADLIESKATFKELDEQIVLLKAKIEEQKNSILVAQKAEDQNNLSLKTKVANLNNELSDKKVLIAQYEDGKIIGNGRSDFTRDVTEYGLSFNNEKYSLLDMPGIEGDESLVKNEISAGVKKAHAVFYINSHPTPPQSGDDQSKGTIGKIKEHLRQQTEVYFIYNKKINNPIQYKEGLVTDEEENSLSAVDVMLKEILKNNYKKHISLSPMPVFNVIANTTDEKLLKKKATFLKEFGTESAVLEKMNMLSFAEWIKNDLVTETRQKIRASNLNKVQLVIGDTTQEIEVLKSSFSQAKKGLEQTIVSTKKQLGFAENNFKRNLDAKIAQVLNGSKEKLRNEMYDEIDYDISNDQFKTMFKQQSEKEIELLSGEIGNIVDAVTNGYQTEIKQIKTTYEQHMEDNFDVLNFSTANIGSSFKTTFNIKDDGSWKKLAISTVATVGTVIAVLSNPAGWVFGVISIIGAMVSMVKGLWGFFDSSYKMNQQRQAVDVNLNKMYAQIKQDITANLSETQSELHSQLIRFEKMFETPQKYFESTIDLFEDVTNNFQKLTMKIK